MNARKTAAAKLLAVMGPPMPASELGEASLAPPPDLAAAWASLTREERRALERGWIENGKRVRFRFANGNIVREFV